LSDNSTDDRLDLSLDDPDLYERLRLDLLSMSKPFRDWAGPVLNDHPQLYHYTNSAGLMGVLGERTIRATHVHYLNDRSELEYAYKVVREQARRFLELKPESSELVETAVQTMDSMPATRFVACFCAKPDLLSQWRTYGSAGGGFAIGSHTGVLRNLTALRQDQRTTFLDLFPVIYDESLQRTLIGGVFEQALQVWCRWKERPDAHWGKPRTCCGALAGALRLVAPAIKHESFSEELEIRLVATPFNLETPCNFRERSGIIVPYHEIPLMIGDSCPVRSIWIGPAADPDIAEQSLGLFLHARQYAKDEVEIHKSKIPLRVFG
jgi:Protein of unknown function (DUF2971)